APLQWDAGQRLLPDRRRRDLDPMAEGRGLPCRTLRRATPGALRPPAVMGQAGPALIVAMTLPRRGEQRHPMVLHPWAPQITPPPEGAMFTDGSRTAESEPPSTRNRGSGKAAARAENLLSCRGPPGQGRSPDDSPFFLHGCRALAARRRGQGAPGA